VSTAVSIRPAAIVFHEEQFFDWRVYALIGALELFAGYWMVWWTRHWGPVAALLAHRWSLEFTLGLLVAVAIPYALVIGLLHMTTEVTATEVCVWFGWVPVYRRALPISGIRSYHVVEYRPILDYGGWGIRAGRNGVRMLSARGNRGVHLDLVDGTKLLIGSQRPDELAETLERARSHDPLA
jgi:hypothetical protein